MADDPTPQGADPNVRDPTDPGFGYSGPTTPPPPSTSPTTPTTLSTSPTTPTTLSTSPTTPTTLSTSPTTPPGAVGRSPRVPSGSHRRIVATLATLAAGIVAIVVVIALLVAAPTPRSSSGSANGTNASTTRDVWVGHQGRWLTNASGATVVVHGINMVNKLAPYTPAAAGFGTAAAATLAGEGFDVVRVGVLYQALEPQPGRFDVAYLSSIASTVATLAAHGVYSLIDFHQDEMSAEFGGEGFPSWSVLTGGLPVQRYPFPNAYVLSAALNHAFTAFWSDAPGPGGIGLQERYLAAVQLVAKRFAPDPWVIGYDLFNEPYPGKATTAQLATFYGKAIRAVRSVDTRHLVWYEPWVTFNFGIQTHLGTLPGNGLGMSFHAYCPDPTTTPAATCSAMELRTLVNADAHAAATGNALMLSEFGASNDLADLARVVKAADTAQLPWIEWSYCGCSDPTGTVPASAEGLVTNPALPGTGSNVNHAKLAVLAEPYPRVVAGTPVRYGFDPTTRTFRLEYTTTAPGGRRFGAGACSTVVVPPTAYPTGYSVTVTGARVTSAPGAGVVDVTETAGASTVTLRIHPATGGRTRSPGVTTHCA
ncbi:MAG: cellulase family glycosylhydrolase [Actinomycetota bacterium]|nr:cellulase family glycosylhydrolase [Actinomycetota bacterium]